MTYERFTDRARKAMQLANQAAQRMNHEYIGTEHMLLGVLEENGGIATSVLKNLEIDIAAARKRVDELVPAGPDMVTMGKLPQTPRAKKVIEYSMEEARNLGHNYVGTEHILLGLVREQDGVAGQVLRALGLTLDAAKAEVVRLLTSGTSNEAPLSTDVSRMVNALAAEREREMVLMTVRVVDEILAPLTKLVGELRARLERVSP